MVKRPHKPANTPNLDPGETERIEYILKPVLWLIATMAGLAAVLLLAFEIQSIWGRAATVTILLIAAACAFFVRRKQVQVAANLLCYSLWGVLSVLVFSISGVRGPAFSGFVVVLLLGWLLLGRRSRIWLTVLIAHVIMVSIVLEQTEVTKPSPTDPNHHYLWMIQSGMFVIGLFLVYLINGRMARALAKAQKEQTQLKAISDAELVRSQNLKNRADTLERQVIQLQVASLVARDATTVRELGQMLNRAVNLIRDRFGFYHAGIFLIDQASGYAVLRAATGEAGAKMLAAGHRLKVGEEGLVGFVTGSGEPRLALDVGVDATHFKNPSLPETRSEMTLPLKIGNQVIGALDVQSEISDAFDSEDMTILQTLADQLAVAIENARLLDATSRQLEELSVLHAISAAGSEAVSVDALIERATEVIGETLYPNNFGFHLVDEEKGETYVHPSYRGLDETTRQIRIKLGTGLIGRTALDGKPRRSADIARDPQAIQGSPGMHSEMCVPLKVGEKIIGVINAESDQTNLYTVADERLLDTFAGQLSTAIEKLKLFETVRRRAAELEALRQASLHLTSNLELKAVLGEILEHTLHLISADYALIFLYDGVVLTHGASLWRIEEKRESYTQPRDNGLTYQVARTGEMIVVEDMQTHPLYEKENWIGAVVGIPLRSGNQVIGVMHVSYDSRPHRFTEDELNVLKMLADGAAIALANARLYSELQDHAHALAEALAQREELVRLKSEFIQNVSHELRTPLAIARGYIDLLDSGDLGELKDDQRDVIAILSRRVQMLTRMVDDLTAVLEAERTDVVREPVDLTEVVQRLLVDFAGSAYQAGLTLATDIQPNLPPVIGNPTHIQRVLDNLVGNALKFTPRGGVITIRLCFEGYYNLMEVSDTGIGIPKDQLSRVFDRFYQVDGSTTRRFGGTGLGLALVREIVETHRGTVSVSSEVGKGTKFQVRLPVKNV